MNNTGMAYSARGVNDMKKKEINKIIGSLRSEKTSKITKPKPVKSTIYCSELPADFPSSSQGSCALWSRLEGGIAPGVPQAWSTFTASDRCPGQRSPAPLAPAQLLLWKGPIPGQEKEVGTKSMYIKGSEWKKHKPCQNA